MGWYSHYSQVVPVYRGATVVPSMFPLGPISDSQPRGRRGQGRRAVAREWRRWLEGRSVPTKRRQGRSRSWKGQKKGQEQGQERGQEEGQRQRQRRSLQSPRGLLKCVISQWSAACVSLPHLQNTGAFFIALLRKTAPFTGELSNPFTLLVAGVLCCMVVYCRVLYCTVLLCTGIYNTKQYCSLLPSLPCACFPGDLVLLGREMH